jgi:hypothetical protein
VVFRKPAYRDSFGEPTRSSTFKTTPLCEAWGNKSAQTAGGVGRAKPAQGAWVRGMAHRRVGRVRSDADWKEEPPDGTHTRTGFTEAGGCFHPLLGSSIRPRWALTACTRTWRGSMVAVCKNAGDTESARGPASGFRFHTRWAEASGSSTRRSRALRAGKRTGSTTRPCRSSPTRGRCPGPDATWRAHPDHAVGIPRPAALSELARVNLANEVVELSELTDRYQEVATGRGAR